MKLKISHFQILILYSITFYAILLTQEALHVPYPDDDTSDTIVYFEFNKYKCGGSFITMEYWNKPYEFFYDIFAKFYCADKIEDFVKYVYLYFFWTFFIFITICYKKFGFIETIIFIIIFFLAINPNHLVAQGRQIASLFLFISALFMKNNNIRTSLILLLFSFFLHNNMFIFSLAIYSIMNLKKIFRFMILIFTKYYFSIGLFAFLIIGYYSNFFNYLFINGSYIFDAYGNFVFKNRLILSFAKYLFFVQVFSISYILFLKVKSDINNFMACYTYVLFLIILVSMSFKLNFDMMIFRLLIGIKYIFIPICFMFIYRKIIGKKCSI